MSSAVRLTFSYSRDISGLTGEENLLVLLITGCAVALLAFGLFLPYGVASAFGAATLCAAVAIVTTGAWLAFSAERRKIPRGPKPFSAGSQEQSQDQPERSPGT